MPNADELLLDIGLSIPDSSGLDGVASLPWPVHTQISKLAILRETRQLNI